MCTNAKGAARTRVVGLDVQVNNDANIKCLTNGVPKHYGLRDCQHHAWAGRVGHIIVPQRSHTESPGLIAQGILQVPIHIVHPCILRGCDSRAHSYVS